MVSENLDVKASKTRESKAAKPVADLEYERLLFAAGARAVAGIDEVGRGSMAGPVSVGVAVIGPEASLEVGGLIDSKALSPARRESMVPEIRRWCAVEVGHVDPQDVDALGMTLSLRLAAQRALAALARRGYRADAALLDGKHDWFTPASTSGSTVAQGDLLSLLETSRDPVLERYEVLLVEAWDGVGDPATMPVTMVIKGDYKCASIAAASVVAKVERDELMVAMDARYPGYEWVKNKGYGSVAHREAISRLGPSPVHRLSWSLPASVEQVAAARVARLGDAAEG